MKKKVLWLSVLGGVLVLAVVVLILHRPGANVIRNGKFEQGLKEWQPYFDKKGGAEAAFTTEMIPGQNSAACKIIVNKTPYYQSVTFGQTGLPVKSGQKYVLTFRARSSVTQLLRATMSKSKAPWTYYGFRVITELTPQWQTYRLTGRPIFSDDNARIMFLCGGNEGEIWITDIRLQEAGLIH